VTRLAAAALALGAFAAAPAGAGEALWVSEGNRLRVVDLASLDPGPPSARILIENADTEKDRGRDVNGSVCPLPDGSGRFVQGEDTGQPSPPAGWGVFAPDGTQVGKLTPTYHSGYPEPYGCAFDAQGRLFTSEVGDQSFTRSTGQLLVWFPPFDRFPGPAGAYPRTDEPSDGFCKLAMDIGVAGGVVIDRDERVYVASASRFRVWRFLPPFPTSEHADGGCAGRDSTGAPAAEGVRREVFLGADFGHGMLTYTGLALSPRGTLYAASVMTGRIAEYDLDGKFLRMVLEPDGWLPPHATGTPQGLAVDSQGTLYYADLDLVREGLWLGPGPNGKVWRLRFAPDGSPQPPEVVLDQLAFPDGLGVFAAP
jgi:hypothetical protein